MQKTIISLMICVIAMMLVGCGIGDAPAPMEPNEVQSAVSKLPDDQQIAYIKNSPMPQAEKDRRIAEIKAKSGG